MIRLVENKNKKKKKRLITVYNYFPENNGVITVKPQVVDQWFVLDVSILDGNKVLNI